MPLGVDDLKNLLRPGAAPGKANKLPAKRGRNKGAKVFADIRQVEYDADLFVRGALRAPPPPPRGKPLGKLVKPRVSNNPARLNGLHPDPERKPKKQAPPPPPPAARKARAKKPEAVEPACSRAASGRARRRRPRPRPPAPAPPPPRPKPRPRPRRRRRRRPPRLRRRPGRDRDLGRGGPGLLGRARPGRRRGDGRNGALPRARAQAHAPVEPTELGLAKDQRVVVLRAELAATPGWVFADAGEAFAGVADLPPAGPRGRRAGAQGPGRAAARGVADARRGQGARRRRAAAARGSAPPTPEAKAAAPPPPAVPRPSGARRRPRPSRPRRWPKRRSTSSTRSQAAARPALVACNVGGQGRGRAPPAAPRAKARPRRRRPPPPSPRPPRPGPPRRAQGEQGRQRRVEARGRAREIRARNGKPVPRRKKFGNNRAALAAAAARPGRDARHAPAGATERARRSSGTTTSSPRRCGGRSRRARARCRAERLLRAAPRERGVPGVVGAVAAAADARRVVPEPAPVDEPGRPQRAPRERRVDAADAAGRDEPRDRRRRRGPRRRRGARERWAKFWEPTARCASTSVRRERRVALAGAL